jgi:hypothetical protein
VKITLSIAAALFLLISGIMVVFDIKPDSENYDILAKNRFTGLGFGIMYKEGLEIWEFAHTVHGGLAERCIFGLRSDSMQRNNYGRGEKYDTSFFLR